MYFEKPTISPSASPCVKYFALPTWAILQLLLYGIPEHSVSQTYPTLDLWAEKSSPAFRLIDMALTLVVGTFVCNLLLSFF